jgi:Spy/CpxP family protein refolding chaperone
MLTKSKLAIAAALVLGAASAAQAASENPSDPTRGFPYGPLGQRMGGHAVNPVDHLSTRYAHAGGAYAFVRPARVHTRNHFAD